MTYLISKKAIVVAASILFVAPASIHAQQADMRAYDIRHGSPAATWMEASPLGNGRLGAMVHGGTKNETIGLNDDTLWSSEPLPHLDGTKHRNNLQKVRDLIYSNKHNEATQHGQQTMTGRYGGSMLPLGNLKLSMPALDEAQISHYDRTLNLNKARSFTTFTHKGVRYQRSVIVSHPDQALVVQLSSSKSNSIDLNVTLDSLIEHQLKANSSATRLGMSGTVPYYVDPHYLGKRVTYDSKKGMRFASVIQVEQTGGEASAANGVISVTGATTVTIKLTAATSYNGFDKSPSTNGKDEKKSALNALEKISHDSFDKLNKRHLADYTPLFSRVDLQLGDSDKQGSAVSERVKQNLTADDPDLDELFYQFGRYLIIASSRKGTQPANLQGIWSRKLNPSWSSNWTTNCNAQFNYLGTGAANLTELREPLQRLVEEASVDGAKVAKSWYGVDGWIFHHNIDLWRYAHPSAGSVLWATFPIGGAWTTVELYDLWKFSNSREELKKLWPIMRGNAQFWVGNLTTDPQTGLKVSCPDVYFENTAKKPNGGTVLLSSAPVSSTIIIRQSLIDVIEAGATLGLQNDTVVKQARATLAQMPKLEIGPNGEIRQWNRDIKNEWKEGDNSQLLLMVGAIYSNQIHPRKSPELAAALKLMLERRKNGLNGEGSWRAAFPANAYARLGLGNLSQQVRTAHFKTWINPNLTSRFIQSEWQIDGNLGLMSSIQECLVQSHAGEIELLPALPDAWKKQGSVRGIALRGGGTINMQWTDGKITSWEIHGMKNSKLKARINGELHPIN